MINIIIASLSVSLLSLLGILTLSLKEELLDSILLILIAFSAGTILGAALLDLLPEAIELTDESIVFGQITLGFTLFFFLERFIYWYHGHGHASDIPAETGELENIKAFAYLNLIGDSVHNFIDGMIIAASFLTNFSVGIATTIAVILHELPQEIGDYGILVYAGFKRERALLLNFMAAFTVVLGGILGALAVETIEASSSLLITLATGGFIYLAASELIPELHKERKLKKSGAQFITFLLGILLIWLLGIALPD